MPLAMLEKGKSSLITHIGGKPEVRQFLEGLGFVVGVPVSVVSRMGGNVIVHIRDTRVAISREMAMKISV